MSQGAQARFAVEPGAAPHTFDANSETYEFLYETVQKRGRILASNGIRGTRSPPSERTAVGAYAAGGRIAMNVSPGYLDLWLPRILGAAEVADLFAVAETLPSFGLLFNRVTQTFQYTDCMVGRWTLHGKAREGDDQPDLLEMFIDVVATAEITGTSMPSLTEVKTRAYEPLTMSQSVFTMQGTTRQVKEFWLLVNNHVQRRWASGSITVTGLAPRDRTVILRTRVPFTTTALYEQPLAGATASLVITNGTVGTTFNFATLQAPAHSPVVRGKTEIDMIIDAVARTVSTTNEIAATNDVTV